MPSPYHRENPANEEDEKKRPHPVSVQAGKEAIERQKREREKVMEELFPDEKRGQK